MFSDYCSMSLLQNYSFRVYLSNFDSCPWFHGRVCFSTCCSLALHPDRSEPVVASGQLTGRKPDSRVRFVATVTQFHYAQSKLNSCYWVTIVLSFGGMAGVNLPPPPPFVTVGTGFLWSTFVQIAARKFTAKISSQWLLIMMIDTFNNI